MEQLVTTRLKTLMTLSWEIQRKKHTSRSKALQNAWAITLNDDIVIYYLVHKHRVQRPLSKHIHPSNIAIATRY